MNLSKFITESKQSNSNYAILNNYNIPERNQISFIYQDISQEPEYEYVKLDNYFYSKAETSGGRIPINDYNIPNNINKFLSECIDAYPESIDTYRIYMLKGYGSSGSPRHRDPTDVVHWQCVGSSKWIIENEFGLNNEIVLNPGDVLWFKKLTWHSVSNSDIKYSIIFNLDKDE